MDRDIEARFRELIVRNPVIKELIQRIPELGLPDCWIAASALAQTVWNLLDGHAPTRGIHDYDVFYFDGSDLSWEAEDAVIHRCSEAFSDIGACVEVRNQARVHLWFDERNGTHGYGPLSSSTESIDRFLETTAALGIRPLGNGAFEVYAPFGFDDLFNWVYRPNPTAIGPERTYVEKTIRRKQMYPRLTVIPWEARLNA